ncbi:TonB family protein [Pontibacter sp. Tf4]|uniref:energy transducer TonB n=1 Tax=Pontibacter sp. Tf4 TaxID=2761620 RepID=UPI001625B6FF|nr:energy transducer TonB [Pontibacter sp. Tf4]MBB6611164.1 TonB family protein [Pontibacter sp. Tf4]
MKFTFTAFFTIVLLLCSTATGFSQTSADQAPKIYEYVEQLPTYKGGLEAMIKYLSNSIPYANAQVQGRVVVGFIVETDGSIQDVKVARGLDPKLDSACVQSVRNMSGHWNPGVQDGKPVRVRFALPISFTANSSRPASEKVKEEMPEYKGGTEAFVKFMKKNARYPREAKKRGVVYVAFVINEDGSLSNYEVKKSIEPALDAEALRLAKLTEGNWIPGEQNGQKVKIRYTMPVIF